MSTINPIMSSLLNSIPEGYRLFEVDICEEDETGEAVLVNDDGRKQIWYYNKDAEGWQ